MYLKMDFDETTQLAKEKSINFKKIVKHGQNLNFMYDCHGYQNEILLRRPVNNIVKTPYIYFTILKIMCRYTNYL